MALAKTLDIGRWQPLYVQQVWKEYTVGQELQCNALLVLGCSSSFHTLDTAISTKGLLQD